MLSCGRGWYGIKNESENHADGCRQCPKGTYSDKDSIPRKSDCIKCNAGRYSENRGNKQQADCKNCNAGTYNDRKGSQNKSACVACDRGKFSETVAAESRNNCSDCPAGFNQKKAEAAFCLPCLPGEFGNTTGMLQCQKCPVGTVSNTSKSTNCTNCPAGNPPIQRQCQVHALRRRKIQRCHGHRLQRLCQGPLPRFDRFKVVWPASQAEMTRSKGAVLATHAIWGGMVTQQAQDFVFLGCSLPGCRPARV